MSIWLLAGTNGGGKSSIGGAAIRAAGADYYDPDEATQHILEDNPGVSLAEANVVAWREGVRLLERTIAERGNFAFETTLGGTTITKLLGKALDAGLEVHVWYVALASPELHLERIAKRVAQGGHAISERDVRRRYDASRHNLIELLPRLASLHVYDNSIDAEPPQPLLVLHMEAGRIVSHCELGSAPEWAKPILLTALTVSV